jgi:hypothetical protein
LGAGPHTYAEKTGGVSRTGPPEITIPTGSCSRRFFGFDLFFIGPLQMLVGLADARRQRERFATGARMTSRAGIEPVSKAEARISTSDANAGSKVKSLNVRNLARRPSRRRTPLVAYRHAAN